MYALRKIINPYIRDDCATWIVRIVNRTIICDDHRCVRKLAESTEFGKQIGMKSPAVNTFEKRIHCELKVKSTLRPGLFPYRNWTKSTIIIIIP